MKKIEIDRPELSDKDILKHKNFESLVNSINTPLKTSSRLMKNWTVGLSVFAVATVLLSFLYLNRHKEIKAPLSNSDVTDTIINQRLAVNPPFPDFDIAYHKFIIDNTKDTTIQYNNGSVITISANAFENNGAEDFDIKHVEIKYREFHTPYDLFVSGIPMKYDSAGTSYTFETAGMLDIIALSNGDELSLKKDKNIDVYMLSDKEDSDFNVYKLDENTGVWTYLGKDKIDAINKSPVQKQNISNVEPLIDDEDYSTRSYLPQKQDKKKYSFSVNLDDKLKDNFIDAQNVLFEVDESKCEFDPIYYSVDWDGIKLEKINEDNFKMQLKKNDKTINLVVYPVYNATNFDKAKQYYETEKKKKEEEKALVLSKRKKQLNDQNNIKNLNDSFIDNMFKPKVFRKITIGSLGICNIDRPLYTEGKEIEAKFLDEYNQEVKTKEIYVVEKGKNEINRFSGNRPSIYIGTKSNKVMWGLTEDNKIVIPEQDKVNSIKKRSEKQQSFQVKQYDNIEGLKKVKQLIEDKKQVEEKQSLKIKTFPNPFINTITINVSTKSNCIVQLINAKGQMLDNISFNSKELVWHLEKYKAGNYYVVVLIPSLSYKKTFKVIKQD